jgi:hypothetical protein
VLSLRDLQLSEGQRSGQGRGGGAEASASIYEKEDEALDAAEDAQAVCAVCCKNDHDPTVAWALCTGSCERPVHLNCTRQASSSLPAAWMCSDC